MPHPVVYLLLLNLLTLFTTHCTAYKVLLAVNCGGESHNGANGITYSRDTLDVGIASDYGKNLLMINRCPPQDQILFQTERYHTATFGYDLPLEGDGEYALILRFSEVYFNAPGQKVFDVVLNSDHTVVSDLDIFREVGRGTAHDEFVYFSVSRGKLYYKEEESDIRGGRVRVEFIKGYLDNPKINAIVLIKGDVENIPKLPPLKDEEVIDPLEPSTGAEEPEEEKPQTQRSRKTSGPKQPDPYSMDDSSLMIPILIAIGAFIPILFCLCKL